MKNEYIIVKAFEVKQPIGTFYACIMNYEQVVDISYADVRRLAGKKREIEEFIGIQRELAPKRVKELSSYVNLIDATFPNTIILSISSNYAQFLPKSSELRIKNDNNVGKVLDGQHRIAGLEAFKKENGSFDTIVVVFIDMELEDQALVFATINQTQTKVSKSLVADLYEFAQYRSPQKTCHNIARVLNSLENSPFKDKIKILGSAIDKDKETITQATFVEAILNYITDDKMKDRDDLKRGKQIEKKRKTKS